MIAVYRIFTSLLALLIYPWARIQAARGQMKWRGRLGLTGAFARADLWIHAASVGEVRTIQYLVDALISARPSLRLQITATTDQGYRTAVELLQSDQVNVSFLPADARWFVRRARRIVNPRVLVIAETEIWPNLVLEAGSSSIPIILINGRMTERSADRYQLIKSAMQTILKNYQRFFFRTEQDQQRFLAVGADPKRCEISGDMKFDAPMRPVDPQDRAAIRQKLGVNSGFRLLVCGSTRPGEEEILLDVLAELQKKGKAWRLVIAPRHLDRVSALDAFIRQRGLTVQLHSNLTEPDAPPPENVVIIVDHMGLLHDLYGAADAAFVGGTLVPIGGHNLLEPVWCGVPVLFGPYLDNVREAAEYILAHRFGGRVSGCDELVAALSAMSDGSSRFERRDSSVSADSATARIAAYLLAQLSHV